MDDTTAQILLQEFRDFRKAITDWQQETGERVAKLEAIVRPALQGNGQPAQIVNHETRINSLEKRWAQTVAVCAAVWSSLQLALHFISWGRH
jgi:hypothetical protein